MGIFWDYSENTREKTKTREQEQKKQAIQQTLLLTASPSYTYPKAYKKERVFLMFLQTNLSEDLSPPFIP